MVLEPLVVTTGDPVVTPVYCEVKSDKITTPEPPFPPVAGDPLAPPPPPPVFAVPLFPVVKAAFPPPPVPPVPCVALEVPPPPPP